LRKPTRPSSRIGGAADPNNPAPIRIHGNHFVPSAVSSNGPVISFLTNSIGSNVANIPVSKASLEESHLTSWYGRCRGEAASMVGEKLEWLPARNSNGQGGN
jgi:hypothetical protein